MIPRGLTHIVLVISQPLAVGAWCTFCLLAAGIMLPMIRLTVDEVVTMAQFLPRSIRAGKPFWRTFFLGGTIEGGGADERSPSVVGPPKEVVPAMVWGMSAPWTLVGATAIGLWLMAAPSVFGIGIDPAAADSDHLVGALVVVFAVCAMAEVIRGVRLGLLPLAMWLVVATWFLPEGTAASRVNDLVCGLALVGLAVPRGVVRERYGAWRASPA